MAIGDKIFTLRKEKGWSQRELSRRIGIHYTTMGRWERDEVTLDVNDLVKLSKVFEVSADYLLFDNVPKDGKIDIPDLDLLRLFEDASRLAKEEQAFIKKFLKAFVFKEKITSEIVEEIG